MLEILFFSFLIMLASLSGVVVVWQKTGKLIEENLSFLVSFSAGVFLVVAYQLSLETIHHSESWFWSLFWIILGALIVWLLFKFLPNFHHHHDEKKCPHKHSCIDARKILFSDAIHNIGDGILLAVTFGISLSLGIVTALSVFVHELVQEVSEFFVLRQSGFSIKKALIWNFLISSTILFGAVFSFFMLDKFEILEIPLLGISAGSFLVVVFYDLIPHSAEVSKKNNCFWQHLSWFLIGLILMFIINGFFGHFHDHDHDHDHHHDKELGYHGYYGDIVE